MIAQRPSLLQTLGLSANRLNFPPHSENTRRSCAARCGLLTKPGITLVTPFVPRYSLSLERERAEKSNYVVTAKLRHRRRNPPGNAQGKGPFMDQNSGERRFYLGKRPPMGQHCRLVRWREMRLFMGKPPWNQRDNLSGIKDRGVNSERVRPFFVFTFHLNTLR